MCCSQGWGADAAKNAWRGGAPALRHAHPCALCPQMRQWGEELAALRAAAPNADSQWLTSNTKRCPQCMARIQASRRDPGWWGEARRKRAGLLCRADGLGSHCNWKPLCPSPSLLPCSVQLHGCLTIQPVSCACPPLPQKHGGCNHMTCKGCGHHFCWVCGRAWSQHSERTGGCVSPALRAIAAAAFLPLLMPPPPGASTVAGAARKLAVFPAPTGCGRADFVKRLRQSSLCAPAHHPLELPCAKAVSLVRPNQPDHERTAACSPTNPCSPTPGPQLLLLQPGPAPRAA